jgi:hypothetical protein
MSTGFPGGYTIERFIDTNKEFVFRSHRKCLNASNWTDSEKKRKTRCPLGAFSDCEVKNAVKVLKTKEKIPL